MRSHDLRGNPVTNVCDAIDDVFEAALRQLQTYTGDPVATLDRAIEACPGYVMAHLMRAELLLTAAEKPLLPEIAKSLAAAEALASGANERERMHIAATRAWLEGRIDEASRAFYDITTRWPRDVLALQVGHISDFFLGNAGRLRDRIASVLPAWDASVPGYHAILGMQAFGLEECGEYARAEEAGQRAVALNARDAWAVHAVAHVYEMQGRQEKGVEWLASRVLDWAPDNFFAVHNWWHLALFHLDLGATDKVLELYDEQVRAQKSQTVMDMLDATALLWRLELAGADVGNRWDEIAETWAPLAEDGFYAYNDLHAVMSFLGAGRRDLVAATMASLGRAAEGGAGDNAMMAREVGLPAARAMVAFKDERYGDAAADLMKVRYVSHRFGGSNAQRDLLNWTLAESALRGGDAALAQAIANERSVAKPASRQNRRMAERARAAAANGRTTGLRLAAA